MGTNRLKAVTAVVVLLMTGLHGGAGRADPALAQPPGEGQHQARHQDAELDGLMDQLYPDNPDTERQLANMEAHFPESQDDTPSIYELLVVTKRDNELLTDACRRQAVSEAVDTLAEKKGLSHQAAVRKAAGHVHQRQDFIQQNGISYAGYLKHVTQCKGFCRPFVAHLINCHVSAVSNLDHGIVLFPLNSDTIQPQYNDGVIAKVVRRLQDDPAQRVMLVGRASRIGSLRYNKALSARRALALQQRLVDEGVAAGRIKPLWFGWEEPQLNAWIAREYGLAETFDEIGPKRMNQSVMIVLF